MCWRSSWSVPGQHQLSGLAHEGSHHILFRNRSSTSWRLTGSACSRCYSPARYHYRLQHLAHHQFVNDPQRDPDVSQLQDQRPLARVPGRQAGLPADAAQAALAAEPDAFHPDPGRYNATGTDKNPYLRKRRKPSKVAVRVGIAVPAAAGRSLLTALTMHGDPLLAGGRAGGAVWRRHGLLRRAAGIEVPPSRRSSGHPSRVGRRSCASATSRPCSARWRGSPCWRRLWAAVYYFSSGWCRR